MNTARDSRLNASVPTGNPSHLFARNMVNELTTQNLTADQSKEVETLAELVVDVNIAYLRFASCLSKIKLAPRHLAAALNLPEEEIQQIRDKGKMVSEHTFSSLEHIGMVNPPFVSPNPTFLGLKLRHIGRQHQIMGRLRTLFRGVLERMNQDQVRIDALNNKNKALVEQNKLLTAKLSELKATTPTL